MSARVAELMRNAGLNPEATRVQCPLEPMPGSRPHSQGDMWGQRSSTALYDQDLSQEYDYSGAQLGGLFANPGGTQELKKELREVRKELKEKIEEIKQIKDIMNKDFDKLQEFVDLLKGMQQDMDTRMEALLDIQKNRPQSGPVGARGPLAESLKVPQMLRFGERPDSGHAAPPALHQKVVATPRPGKAPPGSYHPLGTCEECSFCAPKNSYNLCKEAPPAWLPYSPLASSGAAF